MGVPVYVGDRVLVTTTTTGTGTYSIDATAVTGYLTPAGAGVTSGVRVAYVVVDSLTNPATFEVGEGTYTAGSPSTVTRTLIVRNSSGGTTAVNWSAGTKYLFFAPSATRFVMYDSDGALFADKGATFSSTVFVGATVTTPGAGNTNTGATIGKNGAGHFSADSGSYVVLVNRNDTEGGAISFNRSGTQIGFIYVSTSVRYATSSDYRLKENFEVLEDGIFTVQSVPVYRFNWKEKPDGPKIQGFLAHEVQEFLPQAVIGEKDGEAMQGIDHSQLVPALWGAMKTLIQRVEDLEDQVRRLTPP